MQVHYLEIVGSDVDGICAAHQASGGVEFGAPVAALGNARVATLANGGMIGVRAPMHESEAPVTRPYFLVSDIAATLASAVRAGAEVAHPPMQIPDHGTFAIVIHGGVQQGFWQL